MRKFLLPLVCLFCIAGCKQKPAIPNLKYLGDYVVGHNAVVQQTILGGLSGIDYDAASGQYYLISDHTDARYYTAKINLTPSGIDTVIFTGVQSFSPLAGDSGVRLDPEDIRLYAPARQIFWSNEGERLIGKDTVLSDPAIEVMDMNGAPLGQFPLPDILHVRMVEKGPRRNGVIEGISFSPDAKFLYAALEEPLFEDGPRASLKPENAWVRIFKFEAATAIPLGQYAYKLEPVAKAPSTPDGFIVNGISEILCLGNDKLLVIERSFSTGQNGCSVKLFIADLASAGDITENTSMIQTPPDQPVTKNLLLDMDLLGIYTDNIEGVTFGPPLPNGHKTLVFIADNNFKEDQKTQFLLFEVVP